MAGAHILIAIVFTILQLTVGQQGPACSSGLSSFNTLQYGNNEDACWTFDAYPGEVVVLICDTFHTEDCCDNLRVHDGPSANSYEIALLAGEYHNGVGVSSQGSSMYVRWYSDSSVTAGGFDCRFESHDANDPIVLQYPSEQPAHENNQQPEPDFSYDPLTENCDSSITFSVDSYGNNERECFTYTAFEDEVALLTCHTFCTESNFDFLYLFEEDLSERARLHGQCNIDDVITVATRGRSAIASWFSDGSVTRDGFSCRWSSVVSDPSLYEDEEHTATTTAPHHNTLPLVCDTESDEFTRLDYANSDAACSNYTASSSEAAVLTCDHFCTEAGYDYMRVYNDVDGSLLGTYHGGHCDENSNSNQHLIVVSTSGRISASWSSDGSVTRTGFSCSFTSVAQADAPIDNDNSMFEGYSSGGDDHGTGYWSTPVLPSEPLVCDTESDEFTRLDYANHDAACSNYTAASAEAAVLTCDHFCTETGYDYMRVYNDADGSLLGTYHGGHCDEHSDSDQHLIVVSTSGRISASWSSDGSVTRTGFSCLFTSVAQADAPIDNDNSMFEGYSSGSN